jgi:hypothetical protein
MAMRSDPGEWFHGPRWAGELEVGNINHTFFSCSSSASQLKPLFIPDKANFMLCGNVDDFHPIVLDRSGLNSEHQGADQDGKMSTQLSDNLGIFRQWRFRSLITTSCSVDLFEC